MAGTDKQASAERIVRIDRQLAWVTTLAPLIGTVIAVGLLAYGVGIGWLEVGLFAGMYLLAIVGLEVGWHRHFAHRAFETTRAMKIVFAVLGSLAFQGPVVWWVATHRRHHAHADHDGDPHSPRPPYGGLRGRLRGLWEAHSGWTFDGTRARPPGWARHAKDLYKDEDVFRVHYNYFAWVLAGLVAPAVVGGLVSMSIRGAVTGLLWGGVVRIFVLDHTVRALNSIAHTFGSRTFDTDDTSRNSMWLVLPTMGQGWHHNHHAFPRSAVTSMAWWQIDPGAWLIRALEMVGVVWNVTVPAVELIEARRSARGHARHDAGAASDAQAERRSS